MSAYVIVDIEVTDPAGYETYKQLAADSVQLFGGKYLARGRPNETIEGDLQAHRLVILEFESPLRRKPG